jgi:hypothetical protein
MQKPPTNPTPKPSKIYMYTHHFKYVLNKKIQLSIVLQQQEQKNVAFLFGAKVCICCKKLWAFSCGKFNDFLNFMNFMIILFYFILLRPDFFSKKFFKNF